MSISSKVTEDLQSHYLQVRLAQLSLSQMIGIIERYIKWRIQTSTMQQLLHAETELMDKMREVQEGKASLSTVYKAWSTHPLQKLLFNERARREYLLENNSADYLGPLGSGLSTTDIRDYLIWKSEKHGSVQDWQKDKKRSLVVIPVMTGPDKTRPDPTRQDIKTNEKEETKTNHGRLPSVGEGINLRRFDSESSPKSFIKAQIEGESKAYGPRGKR